MALLNGVTFDSTRIPPNMTTFERMLYWIVSVLYRYYSTKTFETSAGDREPSVQFSIQRAPDGLSKLYASVVIPVSEDYSQATAPTYEFMRGDVDVTNVPDEVYFGTPSS